MEEKAGNNIIKQEQEISKQSPKMDSKQKQVPKHLAGTLSGEIICNCTRSGAVTDRERKRSPSTSPRVDHEKNYIKRRVFEGIFFSLIFDPSMKKNGKKYPS